jgi:alkylation response protein AidB-like acyl-CoA dehydrogenase
MSFALCPMLSLGAIEALLAHGTPAQQALYLPQLVSGAWTGTMNLTEPQAGSDVGAVRTRAWQSGTEPDGTPRFRIEGQKTYITWGDHDVAENIVHLVLARLPGAPEGTRGLSLFLVPKFLPDAEGRPGVENDLRPIGLEHKLGIHASPTCTMQYGGGEGAVGWLIGPSGGGIAAMFTMMNSARLNVGLQGVAIAERAYQRAVTYAAERRQGAAPTVAEPGPARILAHPDVRRMLMQMRSRIAAARGICLLTAVAADRALQADTDAERTRARRREEFLTPIAKAWSTDIGVEVTSLAVQVHGGMGFCEDTGAAQHFRDARIAPIYEGTNGIQAIDLAGRKLSMAGGAALSEFLEDVAQTTAACRTLGNTRAQRLADRLAAAAQALAEAGAWMRAAMAATRVDGLSGATAFLRLAGDVAGGWALARGVVSAHRQSDPLATDALTLAGFYGETTLSLSPGLRAEIEMGAELVFGLDEAALGLG